MPDTIFPKCAGVMQDRFVIENHPNVGEGEQWVERKLNHTRSSRFFGLKTSKDAMHPVSTFRCSGCGFLESYAAVS